MSLAGLGMELTAAVIGATLLGFWIDRRLESEPWGVVIGALVGIVGGLYNFVRQASRAAQSTRDREGS
ncbi:MAG: AtpZ/AtpI family protein [Acidobacteriota bacterium]|nr:AtpZ/AtpI family protein [Acidobacteriota bacterium]